MIIAASGLDSFSSRIHGPHTVLLSYLATKISGFVGAANFRMNSVGEGRRTPAEDINEVAAEDIHLCINEVGHVIT